MTFVARLMSVHIELPFCRSSRAVMGGSGLEEDKVCCLYGAGARLKSEGRWIRFLNEAADSFEVEMVIDG